MGTAKLASRYMIFIVPQSQKAFLSYIKSDSTSVCYFVQEFKDAIVAQQQMRARASAAPATKRASSNSKANEQTKQVLTETWKLIMRCVDDDEKSFKKSIEVLFSMFDRDGDGTIDIAELTRGLSALGVNLSPAQVAALRDTMDTDQDGTISMSEFMTALERERARVARPSTRGPPGKDADVETVRLTWDKVLYVVNKDPKVWERSCSLLFAAMDRDGSGEIDIEE